MVSSSVSCSESEYIFFVVGISLVDFCLPFVCFVVVFLFGLPAFESVVGLVEVVVLVVVVLLVLDSR